MLQENACLRMCEFYVICEMCTISTIPTELKQPALTTIDMYLSEYGVYLTGWLAPLCTKALVREGLHLP